MYNDNKFTVDLSKIHLNRRPGISGMMRVKNDGEFIEKCVESCIEALDELVIVYNGCTDDSPEIISKIAKRYHRKIKVFHYEPYVISGSLTKEEYERAKILPINSTELLANYYNFALSKTTCTHVMKIDADQIYFSDLLKNLCDRVRSAKFSNLSIHDWITFYKLAKNIRYFNWKIGDNKPADFVSYRKVLEYLCCKGILSVGLSGINVFKTEDETYITQGLLTDKLNILGQFNGGVDNLIFKVKKGVRFVPFDDPTYNKYVSSKYTFIEKLKNAPRGFSWGLIWWHLNSMRRNIYEIQKENLKTFPSAFISINEFMKITPETLQSKFNPDLISIGMSTNFTFCWTNCKVEIPTEQIIKLKYNPILGLYRN